MISHKVNLFVGHPGAYEVRGYVVRKIIAKNVGRAAQIVFMGLQMLVGVDNLDFVRFRKKGIVDAVHKIIVLSYL